MVTAEKFGLGVVGSTYALQCMWPDLQEPIASRVGYNFILTLEDRVLIFGTALLHQAG